MRNESAAVGPHDDEVDAALLRVLRDLRGRRPGPEFEDRLFS